MKQLFCVLVVLFLVSCRNTTEKTKNDVSKETPSEKKNTEAKVDTIVKVGKPFDVNGIKCNWKQIDSASVKTTIELLEYKTNRVLLSYSDESIFENDFNAADYFNEHFKDLNFDGLKDFLITSKGSTAMTDLINIYIFNPKTKTFGFSENLSDNTIEEINNEKRMLVTSSFNIDDEIIQKHYFDSNGKITYSEMITKSDFTGNDNVEKYKNRYEKIVNGEIVKTKVYITTE
ncbi:XAC2610-related protein [Flavobacterium gelatinilyticum]|uniref:XAC2610-related protein n=1 Tax=Flavobacterium gelatinilyticum TaxID=3003260 RepID=UPI002480B88A|nr:hypothetical protein [Flavobacterium gelatinilyticum]